MSLGIAGVHARVGEIQSRFAAAPPPPAPSSVPGGSNFEAALARELGAATPGAATPGAATPGAGPGATQRGQRVSGQDVVAAAKQYLGVPYAWGGTDPEQGLDCSGFVQRVYQDLGFEVPRVSRDQAKAGRPVESLEQAKPGDLVAFGSPVDHIGIYLGAGKMIVAPHRGEVVQVQDIGDRQPAAIRRILPDEPVATVQGFSEHLGFLAPGVERGAPAGGGQPPGGAASYRGLFEAAGARHGVAPGVLEAVARAESGFDPRAVSSAGALGLMQIMPSTAQGLGVDPLDPAQAVDGAARLLAGHGERFGSLDLALAAYNAGAGAVERHGGIPPYGETRTYVQRVLSYLQEVA